MTERVKVALLCGYRSKGSSIIRYLLIGEYIVNTRNTATERLKMEKKISVSDKGIEMTGYSEPKYTQEDLEKILEIHAKVVIKAFLDGMDYQEKSERPF